MILLLALLLWGAASAAPAVAAEVAGTDLPEMAAVKGGRYVPLYGDGSAVEVAPFRLDAYPVTNAAYLAFVRAQPRWRRARVPTLLAGEGYLRDWQGDLELGASDVAPRPDAPVVYVSWFAARAYCRWRGARLPTLDEWELVALADFAERDDTQDPDFDQRIVDWYGKPRPPRLPAVGASSRSVWGIYDLHGLIWEWVDDFNSLFVTEDGSVDPLLFCTPASAGANHARNYGALLRYALRSSLEANNTVGSVGFRCAEDAS